LVRAEGSSIRGFDLIRDVLEREYNISFGRVRLKSVIPHSQATVFEVYIYSWDIILNLELPSYCDLYEDGSFSRIK